MSEIEKVQIEIAKAKLAQEQLKLKNLQKIHSATEQISNGISVAGGAIKKTSFGLVFYIGRWILAAIITAFINCVAAWLFLSKHIPLRKDADFLYQTGELLGYLHVPNTISILLSATIIGFIPIKEWKDIHGIILIISLIVFGGWYFLRKI
jgi:hypothetical protein